MDPVVTVVRLSIPLFLGPCVCQNQQESLSKCRFPGPIPRRSGLGGRGWDLGSYVISSAYVTGSAHADLRCSDLLTGGGLRQGRAAL